MKKLSVLLVVVMASAASLSAQDWGFGGRLGSGLQAVGQRYLYNGNYIEARLGMDWIYGDITANFSAMHVWRVSNMDWSDEGNWFFDIGAGGFLGGASNYVVFGVQGMTRLGYQFENAPVSLSIDWSPAFGPEIAYARGFKSVSRFNARGIANLGISCVYRF